MPRPVPSPDFKPRKLSLIIPIYNEIELLPRVLEKVRAVDLAPLGLERELILVDDFSKDGTREWLRDNEHGRPDSKIALHKRNHGKGRAIRTGLKIATGDIILVQDADLEYDPAEIPEIIAPIVDGRTEVTYGSRFLGRTPTGMRLPNYVANKLLAFFVAILFGQVITDEATAYKAFRAEVIKGIPLKCERFEFCPEVTAKLLLSGYRIHEVPVTFFARTFEEGKKIGWRDFIEAVTTLLRCRFRLM
ncbi:MAG: glycosyltransferase family 2 protein [Sumerlaeia bacterium]